MQPLLMDLLVISTERLYPCRCQVLRHNMLDTIIARINVAVNIFIFERIIVFKAFQYVDFVFAVHLINLPLTEQHGKFVIVRETSTLFL